MANTIEASFGLNLSPLRAAASKAIAIGRGLARGFARVLTGPLTKLGAVLGTLFAGAAFLRGVKAAYDLGDSLADLSARTGIGVKNLVILRQQLQDNGMAADDLGGVINKLQNSLGKKGAGDALAGIGIALSDLQGMAPDAQFIAVGKAIGGIQNPAIRAQAAIALFGRSGGELLTLFSDPSFGSGSKALGAQAELLARNAATFGIISDRLGRAGNVLRGFFLGVAERITGAVLPLLTRLEGMDLIGIGQKFGDAITAASQIFIGAFKSPELIAVALGAALNAALAETLNFFVNGLIKGARLFVATMLDGVANVLKFLGADKASNAASVAGAAMRGAASSGAGDLFGAEQMKAAASVAVGALRGTGKADLQNEIGQPGQVGAPDKWKRFSGFETFSRPSLSGASGLTSGKMFSGSLASEGKLEKAYGLVQKGDAARRKAEEAKVKTQEEKMLGALDKIAESNARVADITEEAWG